MKSILYGPKRTVNVRGGRTPDGELRQKFYRSRRWADLKNRHLSAMPWCEQCLTETGYWNRENVIVDHIKGHNDPDWLSRFWDPSNLQTLCQKHHNQKTGRERIAAPFAKKVRPRMSAKKRMKIRRQLNDQKVSNKRDG